MLFIHRFQSDPMGFTSLAVFYCIGVSIIILVIDWIIQLATKYYKKIILIEFSIIGLFTFLFLRMERTKTILIPDNFGEGYITIIYGVENAPKLPVNFFTWTYEVPIPQNGILLTSSECNEDLPKTNVKTYSRIDLSEKELGFGHFIESEIDCNTKQYKYKSWIIQKHCCISSSKDGDSLENVLKNVYCK